MIEDRPSSTKVIALYRVMMLCVGVAYAFYLACFAMQEAWYIPHHPCAS
jgi:hypothetical protein